MDYPGSLFAYILSGMAKKPTTKKDKARPGYMLRLPEPYRELFKRLIAKSRRTATVEAQLAIDAHAIANGETPPPVG